MSVWSDMSTIVTATLAGDINFKVVKAYRSDAAWIVFGLLTFIGSIVFYYRERLAEKFENARGASTINFTHPIIAICLALALVIGHLDDATGTIGSIVDGFKALFGGYHRVVLVGLPVLLILLERTPERTIVIYSYIVMAAIIFIGVIQRFVFSVQMPWASTIPPLLFMIMAWYGATLNIRLRTHLSFSEFRMKMGRSAQMFWLTFDNVLWMVFCVICVTTMARQTVNAYDNFAIVLGTDDIMRWWFLFTMPLCFVLLATRAIENILEDYRNYKNGNTMIKQAVIGGDT
ncbi:MAG: TRAP transporter small permease subunit [Pseudomonadota bacterium]